MKAPVPGIKMNLSIAVEASGTTTVTVHHDGVLIYLGRYDQPDSAIARASREIIDYYRKVTDEQREIDDGRAS